MVIAHVPCYRHNTRDGTDFHSVICCWRELASSDAVQKKKISQLWRGFSEAQSWCNRWGEAVIDHLWKCHLTSKAEFSHGHSSFWNLDTTLFSRVCAGISRSTFPDFERGCGVLTEGLWKCSLTWKPKPESGQEHSPFFQNSPLFSRLADDFLKYCDYLTEEK